MRSAYVMRRYRFTWICARAMIAIGITIILVTALAGVFLALNDQPLVPGRRSRRPA